MSQDVGSICFTYFLKNSSPGCSFWGKYMKSGKTMVLWAQRAYNKKNNNTNNYNNDNTSNLKSVRAQVGFKKLLLWNYTVWERKGCNLQGKNRDVNSGEMGPGGCIAIFRIHEFFFRIQIEMH